VAKRIPRHLMLVILAILRDYWMPARSVRNVIISEIAHATPRRTARISARTIWLE
jgi:hypothetical protein